MAKILHLSPLPLPCLEFINCRVSSHGQFPVWEVKNYFHPGPCLINYTHSSFWLYMSVRCTVCICVFCCICEECTDTGVLGQEPSLPHRMFFATFFHYFLSSDTLGHHKLITTTPKLSKNTHFVKSQNSVIVNIKVQ